jgi:glycosyltransferase involved in cell wall biosynthesis
LKPSPKIAVCNDLVMGSMGEKVWWEILLESLPGSIGIDIRNVGETGDYAENACNYIRNHYPEITVIIQNATFIGTIDKNRYTIAFLQDDLRSMGRSSEQQENNLRTARKVVSNSLRTARSYPEFKFEIIPIGVNSDLFKPLPKTAVRREMGFGEEIIGIFVGDFSEVKGWSKIYACLNYFQDITWILVSKYDESFSAPNTQVYNRISQELLAKLLNCADFYIVGSPVGTKCLSAIEASLCDIPVIMHNIGIFEDFTPEERATIGIFGPDFVSAIKELKNHHFTPRDTILAKKLTINDTLDQWKLLLAKIFVEIERGY